MAVLSDAFAEAFISANIQPLLRRSFGEGGFSLQLGNDRTFNVVLEPIGHLFCAVVKKRLCNGDILGNRLQAQICLVAK